MYSNFQSKAVFIAVALSVVFTATEIKAEQYPKGPITMVVPWKPGGGTTERSIRKSPGRTAKFFPESLGTKTATRSNPLTRREVDRLGRLQVAHLIKGHPTLTPPRGGR